MTTRRLTHARTSTRSSHFAKLLPGALFAVVLLSQASANAQLRWSRVESAFVAPETQRVVTAEFPFVNSGSYPIRIRGIKTNCGCTAGKPDKEVVGPGEHGTISVAFNIEKRKGSQDKKIVVRTDDPASDVTLRLRGEVVEGIALRPLVLRWNLNEGGVEKRADITVPKTLEGPLQILGIEGGRDAIDASLIEIAPGRGYELRVSPKPLFAGGRAKLLIGRADGSIPPATLHLIGPR